MSIRARIFSIQSDACPYKDLTSAIPGPFVLVEILSLIVQLIVYQTLKYRIDKIELISKIISMENPELEIFNSEELILLTMLFTLPLIK